jgi:hypothetical protein
VTCKEYGTWLVGRKNDGYQNHGMAVWNDRSFTHAWPLLSRDPSRRFYLFQTWWRSTCVG